MRRVFVFIACSLLIGFSVLYSRVFAFSDIRPGSELETTVTELQKKGILSGYPDGSFKPEKTINRAEALKIIFETVGESAEDPDESAQDFPDVPPKAWFSRYVTVAKSKKIIQGYADGKFRPENSVNRVEFIKMAVTALPFYSNLPKNILAIDLFQDLKANAWYIPYLNAAAFLNMLPQSDDFKPGEPLKRGDASAMIFALSNYLDKNEVKNDATFVPEEAFLKNDPLRPQYRPKELGPDKVIIKRDGKQTVIQQFEAGYTLTLPGTLDILALEQTPFRVMIRYSDSCSVDLDALERGTKTPYEYYYEVEEGFYEKPASETLQRIRDYSADLYHAQYIFADGEVSDHYFAFGVNTILEISGSCNDYFQSIFSGLILPSY